MADPDAAFGNRNVPTHGVGPYEFEVPSLDPGDSYRLDLREYEENGTRGYYTVLSEAGYDEIEIGNQTSHRLSAEINDVNHYPVFPDTVRGIKHDGTYVVTVTNNGTGTASDIVITIEQTGYDTDTQAKERRTEGPARKLIRKFTGLD